MLCNANKIKNAICDGLNDAQYLMVKCSAFFNNKQINEPHNFEVPVIRNCLNSQFIFVIYIENDIVKKIDE